jgi:hypothetical protein
VAVLLLEILRYLGQNNGSMHKEFDEVGVRNAQNWFREIFYIFVSCSRGKLRQIRAAISLILVRNFLSLILLTQCL